MGKRGPRPLPDNVRAINGFADKKGERETIKPDPITPKRPAWLSKLGKANWDYLAPELGKNALLTKRDLHSFAMLCEEAAIAQSALLSMRKKNDKGRMTGDYDLITTDPDHSNRERRHPALIVYGQSVDRFRRMAAEFGLTPAARVNLPSGLPPIQDIEDEDDDESIFGAG